MSSVDTTSENKNLPFETVGIIGAGTMGAGIAQVCSIAGYDTLLYDLEPGLVKKGRERIMSFLEKGKAKGKVSDTDIEAVEDNLSGTTEIDVMNECQLVIEAIPERMDLKHALFQQLHEVTPDDTILASNTSSLSITSIGACVDPSSNRAKNIAGLHFFNPVQLMKLVEVIQGQETSLDTVNSLVAFTKTLNKVPAVCKDTPGFIVNRVARSFYGEALKLHGEFGQDPENIELIDGVLKQAGGFKMGPFELMDLIGIDVNHDVTQSVYNAFYQEARFKPSIIQQKMVEAGTHGRKTGKGFYSYDK